MATNDEFSELRERIGRLGLGDQLYLFELVLGDNRRGYEETRAEMLQQVEALREHERQRDGAPARLERGIASDIEMSALTSGRPG